MSETPMIAPTGPETPQKVRLKRILQRAGLMLLSSSIAFGACEYVTRSLGLLDDIPLLDSNGDSIYRQDALLSYSMRPSVAARFQRLEFSVDVETNPHGYRDDAFLLEDDQKVIVGLGDSYAWGHGVEQDESFFEVAERHLREAGESVRIHNLAVSGYSQLQHRHQIELARKLGAEVVVVAFCITNDALENAGIIQRRLGDSNQRQDVADDSPIVDHEERREPSWLYKQSTFYRLCLARFGGLNRSHDVGSAAWFTFDQFKDVPSERTQAALQQTRDFLDEMRECCESSGIRLAVIAIPIAYTVDPGLFRALLAKYGLEEGRYSHTRMNEFLATYCADRGIPFLDMGIELQARSTVPMRCFFPKDRHYNKLGHRLTGDALAGFLASEALN